MKTKPKRIKRWVNVYAGQHAASHRTARDARSHADPDVVRVAVPLIELRRGEVVVDVEKLMEAIDEESYRSFRSIGDDIRAAIKKVGVR